MTEPLQEYADSRGLALRVDRAVGVLRGVKLIGMESLNGRRYRPAALSAAVGLYEGAKVNVNHPKDGPLAPRDYRDRLGVIRQVEFRPDEGLFGNLHFNPKHALAEQLAWDAENNPRNVGFSHNVLAKLTREGEQTVVEAITHVQSVDLVADPAATQGLFEQVVDESVLPVSERLAHDSAAELARLQEQVQEAALREATLNRRLKIHEMCLAQGISTSRGDSLQEALGAALYETLLAASDEAHLEALITERAEALQQAAEKPAPLASGMRPRSSEPLKALARYGTPTQTAVDFARAIRSFPSP